MLKDWLAVESPDAAAGELSLDVKPLIRNVLAVLIIMGQGCTASGCLPH